MSGYAYNGPDWIEVDPKNGVVIDGVATSYFTLSTLWTPQYRTARGIKVILETAVPDGKVATSTSQLIDDAGRPRRVWDVVDAPPPAVPDGPTLSDWRVALLQMGRFAEVEAAIIAARASGAAEGAVAWQRFEYANNVYRAELLRLAPVMGFSEAEIDESLRRAALVAGGL